MGVFEQSGDIVSAELNMRVNKTFSCCLSVHSQLFHRINFMNKVDDHVSITGFPSNQ